MERMLVSKRPSSLSQAARLGQLAVSRSLARSLALWLSCLVVIGRRVARSRLLPSAANGASHWRRPAR